MSTYCFNKFFNPADTLYGTELKNPVKRLAMLESGAYINNLRLKQKGQHFAKLGSTFSTKFHIWLR